MTGGGFVRESILAIIIACTADGALAQYKCTNNGKVIFQEHPCSTATEPEKHLPSAGKYRCFVDGEVIYSEKSCTTIKSKETIAREAKEAKRAETEKRKAEAKRLEAADQSNFSTRIYMAERRAARNLRDPDSARFEQSFVSWLAGVPAVCGRIAGKNGFGGYSKLARFYVIGDDVAFDDSKSFDRFNEGWGTYCIAPYID